MVILAMVARAAMDAEVQGNRSSRGGGGERNGEHIPCATRRGHGMSYINGRTKTATNGQSFFHIVRTRDHELHEHVDGNSPRKAVQKIT